MIRAEAERVPVEWSCAALCVSSSGYYGWIRQRPSARSLADAELKSEIQQIHKASRESYGSPRVFAELRARGKRDSLGRVERLMRRWEIRGKQRKRHISTTLADSSAAYAPNLLEQRFAPGQVAAWVADITGIRTAEGVLYLAVVLDLEDRWLLGWSTDIENSGQMALAALRMALLTRRPQPGTLHHSDRGGHYTAGSYLGLLERYGMRPSMSRRGNCYDNAVAESFFASLKREALEGIRLETRKQAYRLLFDYIEGFYNLRRRHSSLGSRSPMEYAKLTKASSLRVR